MYRGKTKDVLRLEGTDDLEFRFKDSVLGRAGMPDTGGNDVIGEESGKSRLACDIACAVFDEIRRVGIPNHFVKRTGPDSIRVRRVEPIRLEFIGRNFAWGSYLRRNPTVAPLSPMPGVREITFKNDKAGDPLVTPAEAVAERLISEPDLAASMNLLDRVVSALTAFYSARNLDLVDLKIETGHLPDGRLAVIDDIGYDNCRVFRAGSLLTLVELHAALGLK